MTQFKTKLKKNGQIRWQNFTKFMCRNWILNNKKKIKKVI